MQELLDDFGNMGKSPIINTNLLYQYLHDEGEEWAVAVSGSCVIDEHGMESGTSLMDARNPVIASFLACFMDSVQTLLAQIRMVLAKC